MTPPSKFGGPAKVLQAARALQTKTTLEELCVNLRDIVTRMQTHTFASSSLSVFVADCLLIDNLPVDEPTATSPCFRRPDI